MLQSFRVGDDGRLDQRPPTPVSSPRPSPLGLAVHPSLPILYTGLPAARRVSVYTFNDLGRLAAVTTAANSGVATCWLTVNPTGSRLYTANNADNSVSVYDLTDPLAPVELQHLRLTGGSAAISSASTRPATSSTSSRPARRPVIPKTTCSTSSRSTLTGG